MALFALVDCNNFYVSCERVFRPDIRNKPVVVLSNNDGCIVARSNEIKALGIRAGIAYFKVKDLFKNQDVQVFSSNYQLYGDLSARVITTIKEVVEHIEVYSIDEAFMDLTCEINPEKTAHQVRAKVLQNTGIPTSIGIGPTKTLAKIAGDIAKKNPQYNGVYTIQTQQDIQKVLQDFPIESIWGIGPQLTKLLNRKGIFTALELTKLEDSWVHKNLSIIGLRTVWELRGIACICLEHTPPSKKAITSTRSFGNDVTTLKQMQEAVSTYVVRACEKLRSQKSQANFVYVFMLTNKYKKHEPQRNVGSTIKLQRATNYPPEIISQAKALTTKLFLSGYKYKKAGIILTGLHPQNQSQDNLFLQPPSPKFQNVIKTMDTLNKRYGKKTIRIAATGIHKTWQMRCDLRSPSYTTDWKEILVVKK